MQTCSIDECENGGPLKRGWCNMHYKRWRTNGDPLNPGSYAVCTDPEESFTARVAWDGDHLVWIGGINGDGYGQIWVDGRHVKAHRYAWQREHGPIPDGMLIDHICWQRECVNVDHLRLATQQQNQWNRPGANRGNSLPRGVSRRGNTYEARAYVDGRQRSFGRHASPEAASLAASTARAIHYGEFAGNN